MTALTRYDIKGWRVTLGFVTGAAVAIAYFMIQFFPVWDITLIVGAIVAIVFVSLVGLPLYFYLRHRQMLNIYIAVLVGRLLTALPYIMFTLYAHYNTFIHMEKVGSATLIINNKLTSDGWWYYFFWQPMWFMTAGMIGGLVAWIVAIGVRLYPRRVAIGP
jgi:hypothetical protein